MNESNDVNVVACLIHATPNKQESSRRTWVGNIQARIVYITSDTPKLKASQDNWLSILKVMGMEMELAYSGPLMPQMALRPGILFRLQLSRTDIERALEQVAVGQTPLVAVTTEIIRPMDEPCVRVPLSVLKELRGQEARIEYSRQALVKTWTEDRRTGAAAPR